MDTEKVEVYELEFSKHFLKSSELFMDILNRVKAVPAGTKFLLRDLYTGIFWNTLPTGLRKKAGLYLTTYAQFNDSSVRVRLTGKLSGGQQVYERY